MLGQICCDSNGKLNAQSVLLEAGPEQGGQQVPVDLSELKEYSLFPGQVSVNAPQVNHVCCGSLILDHGPPWSQFLLCCVRRAVVYPLLVH